MDIQRSRIRTTDGAVIVPAREKTNFCRGVTELVFRYAKEKKLSAAYLFDVLHERAVKCGCDSALFCSEKGDPYASPDVICKSMVDVLHDMDIFGYTSYSFRHSLIQALFDAGLNEKQVNAYTGHSNTAHTAITWYYHLGKQWAGQKIRALTTQAKKVIQADGGEDDE
jgi:integrase